MSGRKSNMARSSGRVTVPVHVIGQFSPETRFTAGHIERIGPGDDLAACFGFPALNHGPRIEVSQLRLNLGFP